MTLLDDSRKLAELARKSGVDVTLEVVPEMQHVFQFLAGTAPEADAAIRRLADWVRPKLGLLCFALVVITIRRSKTDQGGAGRQVGIPCRQPDAHSNSQNGGGIGTPYRRS